MTTKEFITPDELFRDSFSLARKIHDSGCHPDFLLVLWRGGAPVGMAVHEYLRWKGVEAKDLIVKVESYGGIEKRHEPLVENEEGMLAGINESSRILIVDDIFDSGETMARIRDLLRRKTRNVKTAVLYWKKRGAVGPDYFVREVFNWIVFPHELADLSPDEVGRHIS